MHFFLDQNRINNLKLRVGWIFFFELQYSGHLYFMTKKLRLTNLNIKLQNFYRQTSYLHMKYAASVLKREKNEISRRWKIIERKLLEMVQVTVPIYFLFWWNLKNEGGGPKTCIFLHYVKNCSKSRFLTGFGP